MRLATPLSRWRSAQRAHVVDQAAIGRGGLGYPMPRDQQMKVTRQRLRAKGEPLPARKKERAPRPFKKKPSLNQRFRHFLCWLDDRFHEPGIEKLTSMELEGCWWIPRLRSAERGAVSWRPGGKRLKWR
jgi:hypothetical protein